jgi:hypothetical protein
VADSIEITTTLGYRASNRRGRSIKGLGHLLPAFSQSYPQTAWTAGFGFKIIDLTAIFDVTPSYRCYLARA